MKATIPNRSLNLVTTVEAASNSAARSILVRPSQTANSWMVATNTDANRGRQCLPVSARAARLPPDSAPQIRPGEELDCPSTSHSSVWVFVSLALRDSYLTITDMKRRRIVRQMEKPATLPIMSCARRRTRVSTVSTAPGKVPLGN